MQRAGMSISDEFGQLKNITSVFLIKYRNGALLISLVFLQLK